MSVSGKELKTKKPVPVSGVFFLGTAVITVWFHL